MTAFFIPQVSCAADPTAGVPPQERQSNDSLELIECLKASKLDSNTLFVIFLDFDSHDIKYRLKRKFSLICVEFADNSETPYRISPRDSIAEILMPFNWEKILTYLLLVYTTKI